METMKQQYNEIIEGLKKQLEDIQSEQDLSKRKYETFMQNQKKSEISKAKHIEKKKVQRKSSNVRRTNEK